MINQLNTLKLLNYLKNLLVKNILYLLSLSIIWKYLLKSLEISKESLGEKHTDVGTSYNNLGSAYQLKGEYDKSI